MTTRSTSAAEEELRQQLAEAREQQTAIGEILRAISGSPTDVQPVLDAIARNAARFCAAEDATVLLVRGEQIEPVAHYGSVETALERSGGTRSLPIGPTNIGGRAILERRVIQVDDILAMTDEFPWSAQRAREFGWRSAVVAPLLPEGEPLGLILLRRAEVRPFTPRQVDLLETFADQAVIAIENVRLFNETKEALERQTAISEILRVIAASPADMQPVLKVIAQSARRYCSAEDAAVLLVREGMLEPVSHEGPLGRDSWDLVDERGLIPPFAVDRTTVSGRAVLERRTNFVADLQAEATEYPLGSAQARAGGYHTVLATPLRREGRVLGVILLRREEVRPFSEHQIDLVRTFADQAVIAIENVRLFNETKEALDQQTATAQVLKTISRSAFDLQSVLGTLIENAARLCHADVAWVSSPQPSGERLRADYGFTDEERAEMERRIAGRTEPPPRSVMRRLFTEGATVHFSDITADAETHAASAIIQVLRGRTVLAVPVRREDTILAGFVLLRRDVRPFTDREVELVETFADQAAIAIENVRLFTQTKEALEQQTAVAEILGAISTSPTDIQPVLDTVARNAARLLEASDVLIVTREGDSVRVAAHVGEVPVLPAASGPLVRGMVSHRAVIDASPVHVPDLLAADAEFPEAVALAKTYGGRTSLAVPLLRQGSAIGSILLRRTEVRPFSEQQIRLLQTFADQAAIAIENVRLFNETKEALDQQTATAQVLQVISRSAFDLQSVLDTLAENAVTLCEADHCDVVHWNGRVYRDTAHYGVAPEGYRELVERTEYTPDRGTLIGRTVLERQPVHIVDVLEDAEYRFSDAQKLGGFRSMLGMPIMRGDFPIGVISVWRAQVRPFTERQIQLLSTFADQAAIAMENVRLFNETKEGLERQTAISEILRVISESPTDVQPVLDAIAQNAATFCGAEDVVVGLVRNDEFEAVAHHGTIPFTMGVRFPIDRSTLTGRALLDATVEHAADMERLPDEELAVGKEIARRFGYRAFLAAPLVKDGKGIGAIGLRRSDPRAFSPQEIDLVRTFADQAVIAIENVRLFNETKEALEQQTATADVLKTISRSTFELQPILDTLTRRARELCGADSASIRLRDGDVYKVASDEGIHAPFEIGRALPASRGSITGRVVLEKKPVQIPDMRADPEYDPSGITPGSQTRTILGVPLQREGDVIGVMLVRRNEVRPLTDRQVQLVQTFADQAVIAIENVRLFNETKEALERQTAIAGILRAISESPTDVQPVLDAIAESAARFCAAEDATVILVDGQTLRTKAHHGPIALRTQLAMEFPLSRGTVTGRSIIEGKTVHVPDLQAESEEEYPIGKEQARRMGHRTTLASPLMREGVAIGAILLRRMDVRPFTEHQLDLVRTFADQAVIAIENVRLFNETKEALERQTASAQILRVIAGSPSDVQPVLDEIAESAARLCAAQDAAIGLLDGDVWSIRAHHGSIELSGASGGKLGDHFVSGHAIVERRTIRVDDLQSDEGRARYPGGSQVSPTTRAIMATPLLRQGVPLGAIFVRRTEPVPFTERHADLLAAFGDQAVIAIENVRLFNETKEALEQQTAIGDVLRVIAESAFNITPVLQTVIDHARRLCGADNASIFMLRTNGVYTLEVDSASPADQVSEIRARALPVDRSTITGRVALSGQTVHLPDVKADPDYTGFWPRSKLRSGLGVPMLISGSVVGVIVLRRMRLAPYSDREIQLVETFARQAAIAFENVRLFSETKDALARQTAVAEVLGTISRSVFDLNAILTTVVQNAVRLCGAKGGLIFRRQGEDYRLEAMFGGHPAFIEYFRDRVLHPGRQAVTMRAVTVGEPVQILDVEADPEYEHTAVREFEPFRTVLGIPLLHQGKPIGAMSLWRNEVREFSVPEIDLVRTFADQAAIAIENVRLFNETKEALGRQTAVAEVLNVITRSAFDLQPALEIVTKSAARLALADTAWLATVEGENYRVAATEGMPGAVTTPNAGLRPISAFSIMGRMLATGEVIHISDISELNVRHPQQPAPNLRQGRVGGPLWRPERDEVNDDGPEQTESKEEGARDRARQRRVEAARAVQRDLGPRHKRTKAARRDEANQKASEVLGVDAEMLQRVGSRTVLAVPLVKETRVIGGFILARVDVRQFSEREVELVKTFADQAAIAIENMRLFRETEEKSQQLEVASRHKSEFLANMSHELRTPLNAIIGFTDVMLEEMFGTLNEKQKEYLEDVRNSGNHLLTLINDILDLSKIEAGRVELELGDFSFPAALDNALTLVRERATRHGITLAAEVAPDLGTITADERKVKQVLVNLLANAVKFTPDGGWVSVSARRANGTVEVAVRDTGIGVAPEDQERIFDEFQQVGRDPDKAREGTGLGLTLAKRFVELHGGRIWVESEVGKGSTFTFAIPVRQTALVDAKG